ncbi:uncharacterized protein LOC115581654 [Sparus aurata]|uniref:uncharacterized protein LOC115581654 n=1 Tax=Sparus aurata TaxID=8175 RepID=UPI0011C19F3A|nr:uncharacterized protein LOC115581654 [Sparus aurata]
MPPHKKKFRLKDGIWSVLDTSDDENDEWNSDDERAVPIVSEGVHGRYIRFAQKNDLPYGDNVAGNVDTLSRWARVRTRRVDALTRRVTHIASTRLCAARTVAHNASFTCANDANVLAACGSVSCADETTSASVCANVDCADKNASDNGCAGVNNSVIEISDDDDDDSVSLVSVGFDTSVSVDTESVVQADRVMLQRPADPLSVGGACSINQIGGGGGDREAEQDAVAERESGSVSFSDDDDDDDNEVRPPIQVRDIPNFNAMELRQRLDFRDISLDNPELVPRRIRERLSGVIDRALDGTHPGSILNAVLRGLSLANDVQAILNSDNQYNTDLFLEEISRVLQSNDTSMSDDELEFIVTVVQNRSGGKRKNINKIPYNKILSEKTRFLFNPDNRGGNNLCFSLCLARFEKKRQEEEKQKLLKQTVDVETLDEQTYAENTHLKIWGDLTSCASFDKVAAFERDKCKNHNIP